MPWEQWTERMEKTINHQSKKGHSQENNKEQSTCAKKQPVSCQTKNKINTMLMDVSCTWEMKRKTDIYLPCLAVQCYAPGTMDRKNRKNNQPPEQKSYSQENKKNNQPVQI